MAKTIKKLRAFLKRISFIKLLLIALVIRLVLLPLSFHGDLNNNAIWGIYAQEFGFRGFYDWLNFGNYARPDYPPLAMILFGSIREIWQILFNFFWKINVSIPVFPSTFIPWFETKGYLMLIKVPGVLTDLGVGVLLYNLLKKKSELVGKTAASFFLFNPAIIYLSSSWGQLDSVVSFFALLSIILLTKKKYYLSFTSYFVSIMVKATYVPAGFMLFIEGVRERIKAKKVFGLILLTLGFLFLVGYTFFDKNYIAWSVETYIKKILPGAVTLPYINLNAFNFWGLMLGLERIPDSLPFLGISLNLWAWAITGVFVLVVLLRYIKNGDVYLALAVLYLTLFMFMPRVHERYLYPVFVFLPVVVVRYKKLLKPFFLLSIIFLLNLYHWWWFPRINFLVEILDMGIVERTLSLANLILFGFTIKTYLEIE